MLRLFGALPLALRGVERFGVPRRVAAFVLPTGYAFNMDGTTVYLAVASVFVAQAAGVAMPLPRQLLMMATLMVTSKGLAGVPRVARRALRHARAAAVVVARWDGSLGDAEHDAVPPLAPAEES